MPPPITYPRTHNGCIDDGTPISASNTSTDAKCPQCGVAAIVETVSAAHCRACDHIEVDYWPSARPAPAELHCSESLWGPWSQRTHHHGGVFIEDGVIDPVHWAAGARVMFLLKEGYHDEGEPVERWDLRDFIRRRTTGGQTFKRLGQWAYGCQHLLNGRGFAPFSEDNHGIQEALLSSAVVNLKKSHGRRSSSPQDLATFVECDWDLLSHQIALIAPTVVVCGNTWGLIRHQLEYTKVADRAYRVGNTLYIAYWHPAGRVSKLMSYYGLCGIVQAALEVFTPERAPRPPT